MSLAHNKIIELIKDIRYADIIVSHNGQPFSLKVTSFLNMDTQAIEFHVPKRCTEIIDAIATGHPNLLKYSTEYAEVSSEWHHNAPKDKRISTIIGVEIHVRNVVRKLSQAQLIKHLEDTQKQNKERIGDHFRIDKLDQEHFMATLDEIEGYEIGFNDNNYKTVENLIAYRDSEDVTRTIEELERLAKENPENKFSKAADLLK